MQIECPFCHALARLPDSKEGAQVRCGGCGRVYRARAPGRGRSKGPSGLAIGLAIGVVAAGALIFWLSNRSETVAQRPAVSAPAEEAPEAEAEPVDPTGWESVPVVAVRSLYEAAHAHDAQGLRERVDRAEIWAFVTNRDAPEGSAPVGPEDFRALNELDRRDRIEAVVETLLAGEHEFGLPRWTPIDGEVRSQTDDGAVVHVRVDKLDTSDGLVSRTLEFRLRREGQRLKVAGWERVVSEAEAEAEAPAVAVRRERQVEKVELSDGSLVFQAEPRPLDYDESTPADLRVRIDRLYDQMIDLEATTEAADARTALVAIGKPAIPKLLTGLYETPLETQDQAIQVNQIVIALRDITGEFMGYKPMAMVGSTTGTTEERRQAAIKAWFAWWLREGAAFEGMAEEADPLEALIGDDER